MANNNEYVVLLVSGFKQDSDFFEREITLPPAKTKLSTAQYYNFGYVSRKMSYKDATEAAQSYIADGFFVMIINTRTVNWYQAGFSAIDLLTKVNSVKNQVGYEPEHEEAEEADEEETDEPRKLKIHRGPCPNPQLGAIVEDDEEDEW